MSGPVCVILITHTPERLRRTILGVASSRRAPDAVVLSCDGDDPALAQAARNAGEEFGVAIDVVLRARAERGRAAQVRNNGVRRLLERGVPNDARLVFFDGDCVPLAATIGAHAEALDHADFVLGWRYEMTPEQNEIFDEGAIRRGDMPFEPTSEQVEEVEHRRRRYRRQLRLRRFGLTKPHKPKLLSANFACRLSTFCRINGFDEQFEGWGQEDDDLGKRLYQAGAKVHLGIDEALVCHQYHPTNMPDHWRNGANLKMLEAERPTVCERGLRTQLPQAEPVIIELKPTGRKVAASTEARDEARSASADLSEPI